MKKHFVWLLLLFPLLLTGCYGEEDKEKDQGDYIWDFSYIGTLVGLAIIFIFL